VAQTGGESDAQVADLKDGPALLRRLSWLVNPDSGFAGRVANAASWAFLLQLVFKVLDLVRTVVLARLIAPNDFGLMGIAMLVVSLVMNFTQLGFSSALVQRKGDLEPEYLNTAWTVEIVRGLALGMVLLAGAPLVGTFFDAPEAVGLTQLMAVGLVIGGFTNVGVVAFDRDLEFQRRFVFRLVPNVADLLVSITLAIVLRSAWALAAGWVASRVATVVASYVAHPYRPRLRWDRERATTLLRFGIWLLGSQVLLYLMLNLDDIWVGRLLGATALGFYQMAFTLSQVMTTEVTSVVNTVAFPAYSRVQDDLPRLRRAYLSSLQFVAFLAFPMAAGLWFVGEEAVRVFLGDKWLPALPAFYVLLLWGLIRSLLATTGPLFRGIGRPDTQTKIQALQLVLLALAIYPLTSQYGIVGAAWATVVAAVVPDTIALVAAARVTRTNWEDMSRIILVPAIQSAVMYSVLLGLANAGLSSGSWVLVWAPLIGVAFYALLTWGSRRWLHYAPQGLLPRRREPEVQASDNGG
jgi:O-antigen/teichoic acid export membrane protein